jgi:hypothetical protein
MTPPWARTATVLVLLAAACDRAPRASDEASSSATALRPTAAIEEVMRYVVDPAADSIWESVVTEVTPEGVVDHMPESDEDWARLRGHALTLVEASNLLLIPGRRVAAEGSRSEMPGVDLEPEQIEALLAESPEAWAQFVGALRESGLVVLSAVEARDVDALLVAGDGLDLACENCHVRYWYPSLATTDSVP